MASDAAQNAAAATKGAARSILKWTWDRITPFSVSGIYTTVGVLGVGTAITMAAAPAAFAAAASGVGATTVAGAAKATALSAQAGFGTNLMNIGTTAFGTALNAGGTILSGTSDVVMNADWAKVGEHLSNAGGALTPGKPTP